MVEENKEEDIVKYSKEAFSFIDDDPKKSIQALCKLKAVGPATASGEPFSSTTQYIFIYLVY